MPHDDRSGWLERCLTRLPAGRVGVMGDFCLDAYWLLEPGASETSIETGLPVRRVRGQRYSLGGAGNVVANLAALGVGEIEAAGLLGEDLWGRHLLELLARAGAGTRGMLVGGPEWQTMVYAKPCVGVAEESRIDFGAFERVDGALAERLAAQVDRMAARCDALVLNQQVPAGASPPEVIERINAVIARRPECRFIVDSRHRAGLYRGAMLKVNVDEAARLLGAPPATHEPPTDARARELAQRLFDRTGQSIFLTRGARGLLAAHSGGIEDVPGVVINGPTDPVGAGDTAVAAIAAALAGGCPIPDAARLANLAASVTVRKLQTTGTATPEEIRRANA